MAETESGRTAIRAPLVFPDDGPGTGAGASASSGAASGTAIADDEDSADSDARRRYTSMSALTLVTLLAEGKDIVGMANKKVPTEAEAKATREQLAVLQPFAQRILAAMGTSSRT